MQRLEIRDPVALQHEFEEFIHVHSEVEEHLSFMVLYPEVYRIYRALQLELPQEVKRM